MISMSAPAILSRRNGNEMPAKFEPPPAQPITTSGPFSPNAASCSLASMPITVWCMSTWLSTEPSEYAASGIGGGALDGLRDREAERAERLGVGLERRAARVRHVRRAGVHGAAERLHHDAPVRLLAVGDADHEDLALEAVELRRVGERRAPLPGAGLGRDALAPVLRAVERLRHGRVGLVRARRAAALVLVVDAHALEPERLLEAIGAHERRRPPDAVGLAHLGRDLVLGPRPRPPAG